MSAATAPFRRFAHPRLAAVVAAGALAGLVGALLWLAGTPRVGARLVLVGVVVAMFGISGYVSVSVFEGRDREFE